jgi:hypothetical protein
LSLSKTTKIAILMQSMIGVVDEDELMQYISWIVNGIDGGRIDWNGLLQEVTKPEGEEV